MSLRRSPRLTPAALEARRANARKSTGPRTELGKARVALNGLKHGRNTVDLPGKLARAGYAESEVRWRAIRGRIAQIFGPVLAISEAQGVVPKYRHDPNQPNPDQNPRNQPDPNRKAGRRNPEQHYKDRIDQVSNVVWCAHRSWGEHFSPKLESLSESVAESALHSLRSMNRGALRIQIHNPWVRVGLVFYTQRRRGWRQRYLAALIREAFDFDPSTGRAKVADPGPEMESGLRCKAYRLARPREWERLRYCLDREGNYHPEWRGAYRERRRQMREAGLGVWLEPYPFRALERQQEQDREAADRIPAAH